MSVFVRNTIIKRPSLMRIRMSSSETKNAAKIEPGTSEEARYTSPNAELGATHKVNGLERYLLVWTKKFPSVATVPAFVTQDTMERCRNIVRIRVNLSLIVLCLMGAIAAMQSGKRAAERGESVTKANMDWHNEYNRAREMERKAA